jgi:hypothetical protein
LRTASSQPWEEAGAAVRTPDRIVAEHVLAETKRTDPVLLQIVSLVRKLEVAYWLVEPESPAGRLQQSLLSVYETKDTFDNRLRDMFAYLDSIYAAGGAVQTTFKKER